MMTYHCPHCRRAFPSQNGLNSHQQVHGRERKARAVKKSVPLTAVVTLRARSRSGGHLRGVIPSLVRDALEARDGDLLVFERITERSAQVALLKGGFVVYLSRAEAERAPAQVEAEAPEGVSAEAEPPAPPAFDEAVKRKIEERGAPARS